MEILEAVASTSLSKRCSRKISPPRVMHFFLMNSGPYFLQFHFFYIFLSFCFFLALSSNENRNEAGNIKQNARMDADDFGMG